MLNWIIAFLGIWCLYNTWELRHNFKQDRIANTLDKMTLRILQIHCRRLDRLEKTLDLEPIDSKDELFKKEEEDGRGDS